MQVDLHVGGQIYGGWNEIEVFRSLEYVTGDYRLTHTERWADQPEARSILPGALCQLKADGQTLINGSVDESLPFYDSTEHQINVGGRDATADLVDCSAIDKQYNGQDLAQIAADIIKPFGIRLIVEADVGAPFDRFDVENETAFEAIERAARQRGVLLMADAHGNLVIGKRSTHLLSDGLELGVNVLSAAGQFSHLDRFSEYNVVGQTVGTDQFFGALAATPDAQSRDPAIKRYRPLTVVAEQQGAGQSLQQRADFERSIRAGRSTRITYAVQGWFMDNGKLWQPNNLVRVVDPFMGRDDKMLLISCRYTLGPTTGTRTDLEVTRPEAFDLIALPDGGAGYPL